MLRELFVEEPAVVALVLCEALLPDGRRVGPGAAQKKLYPLRGHKNFFTSRILQHSSGRPSSVAKGP